MNAKMMDLKVMKLLFQAKIIIVTSSFEESSLITVKVAGVLQQRDEF